MSCTSRVAIQQWLLLQLRLLTMSVLVLGLLPAAEAPLPVVRDQLSDAPWYDGAADSWKRVDLPEDDEHNSERSEGGDGIPGFAYLMYAVVIVAIGLIAVQLWRLRGSGQGLAAVGTRPVAPVRLSALPFTVPDVSGDPEAGFRVAYAAGDWTMAVVWLYAWQLLSLDAAGVVRLLPGKTNRGYLREAAALSAAQAALAETVPIFERAYFGHVAATRHEVEHLDERHRALLAVLPVADGSAS